MLAWNAGMTDAGLPRDDAAPNAGSIGRIGGGIALAGALLVLALYARTLQYDELVWTDASQIGQGTVIRPPDRWASVFVEPLHDIGAESGRAIAQSYYRPLQALTLSVAHPTCGTEAACYRGLSIAVT